MRARHRRLLVACGILLTRSSTRRRTARDVRTRCARHEPFGSWTHSGRERRQMTIFAKQRPPRNLPVAVAVESAYFSNMSVSLSRIVGLAVAVLLLGADATASARPKRHPVAQRPPAQVTTNCDGTPIIMQGMPCRQRPARAAEQATEQTGEQETQARRAPPAHHARQRRSLRPLGSTHAIAVAAAAVGVGLHAAGDRQLQRADQGPQFIFPVERGPRAQSQQSRRLHPLQSQQVMAAAVSAEPPARVCCWRRCGIAGRPVQVCCQGERGPATTAVFMSGHDPGCVKTSWML